MRRLLIPCLLIYAVILFRAAHQSVTVDEADSFLNFANENAFMGSSANHVLNSLLVRTLADHFPLSPFLLRVPSMIGAAFYLAAVASIVTRLMQGNRLLGLAFLTLNPFFLDYLIAARGYSLALEFLASVVALAMKLLEDETPYRRALGMAVGLSLCASLAIAANSSFTFAVLSTVASFLLILAFIRPRWIPIAAAATVPGMMVGFALVGRTIASYPRNELYYGAKTWAEMWTGMLDAVFPIQNLQAVRLQPVLTLLVTPRLL